MNEKKNDMKMVLVTPTQPIYGSKNYSIQVKYFSKNLFISTH